jgi:hypothetical protein
MKQIIIIALFAAVALTMVMYWSSVQNKPLNAADRNVPGATTGKGKNSLAP